MTEQVEIPKLKNLEHQKEIWKKVVNEGVKMAILIWHRRAGKDIVCFQMLLAKALQSPGLYWYVFPYYTQARKSFWEAFVTEELKYIDLVPKALITKKSDVEMKITLYNGSIIRLVGADTPDSLVGSNPNFVVISEYALVNPNVWDQILQPIIVRNKGTIIFNSTPRGENHCYRMYKYLKESANPEHFASLLTIRDTGIVTQEEIDEMRKEGKPEELIQQEYFCSFSGALVGSYYADILSNIEQTNMISDICYNGEDYIQTFWDLGVSDSTAIWFANLRNGRIQVFDYYEANGYGLGHYVDVILNRGYKYSKHNLPHDGNHRTLTSEEKARTIKNQLTNLGLDNVVVKGRTNDVYADIQIVREVLPVCHFNLRTCNYGIECLKNYRREYNEKLKTYKNTPLHDCCSHGADAFRLLARCYKDGYASVMENKHIKPIRWKKKF